MGHPCRETLSMRPRGGLLETAYATILVGALVLGFAGGLMDLDRFWVPIRGLILGAVAGAALGLVYAVVLLGCLLTLVIMVPAGALAQFATGALGFCGSVAGASVAGLLLLARKRFSVVRAMFD